MDTLDGKVDFRFYACDKERFELSYQSFPNNDRLSMRKICNKWQDQKGWAQQFHPTLPANHYLVWCIYWLNSGSL
jgi:hypothetical protein